MVVPLSYQILVLVTAGVVDTVDWGTRLEIVVALRLDVPVTLKLPVTV